VLQPSRTGGIWDKVTCHVAETLDARLQLLSSERPARPRRPRHEVLIGFHFPKMRKTPDNKTSNPRRHKQIAAAARKRLTAR
jgi:hypothetical protein